MNCGFFHQITNLATTNRREALKRNPSNVYTKSVSRANVDIDCSDVIVALVVSSRQEPFTTELLKNNNRFCSRALLSLVVLIGSSSARL